jgi:cytochrome c553
VHFSSARRSSIRSFCLAFLVSFPAALLASGPSGEHLAYTVGCVNCHHQTDKHIINAPPLAIVKAYSLPEFRKLMKTGVTKAGRDMASQGSVMGFVAKEQFAHLTDEEVAALYEYFTKEWTVAKGIEEEKKIPIYFKQPPSRPSP